jgi:hypothetical protein
MGAVHATSKGVDHAETRFPPLTKHRTDSGLSTDNTCEDGTLGAGSGQHIHLKPRKHAQQHRPLAVSEHADAGRSVSLTDLHVPNTASALPAAAFPASASISATNSMKLGAQKVSSIDSVEYPAIWEPHSHFLSQSIFASICACCLSDSDDSAVLGKLLDVSQSHPRFCTAPESMMNTQMLGHMIVRVCVHGTHSKGREWRRRKPRQVESVHLASDLAAFPIRCVEEGLDMCTKARGLAHVAEAKHAYNNSTCPTFSHHLALFALLFFTMASNVICVPIPKSNMFIQRTMPLLEDRSFCSGASLRAHATTQVSLCGKEYSLFYQKLHASSSWPSLSDTCVLVKRAIPPLFALASHEQGDECMAIKTAWVDDETVSKRKQLLFRSECETSVAEELSELSGSWLGRHNVADRVLKFHHCLVMVRRSLNLKGGSGQDGDGGSVSRGSHSPDA